jgi:hypothetical protein
VIERTAQHHSEAHAEARVEIPRVGQARLLVAVADAGRVWRRFSHKIEGLVSSLVPQEVDNLRTVGMGLVVLGQ